MSKILRPIIAIVTLIVIMFFITVLIGDGFSITLFILLCLCLLLMYLLSKSPSKENDKNTQRDKIQYSNTFHARSSYSSMLLGFFKKAEKGDVDFTILFPWNIYVNMQEETIIVRKRSPYLITFNEENYAFRFIRSVTIREHLVGCDIHISLTRGNLMACYLTQQDAKIIKKMLLDYNSSKKGGIIIG